MIIKTISKIDFFKQTKDLFAQEQFPEKNRCIVSIIMDERLIYQPIIIFFQRTGRKSLFYYCDWKIKRKKESCHG